MTLHLTDQADFGLFYDIEKQRYDDLQLEFPCTREHVLTLSDMMPSIGLADDGVQFGGALFVFHEIHFAIHPSYHGRWKALLRPMWEWMFSLEDNVRMRVEKNNPRCLRFMDKQWPRDGEDETYFYYKLVKANLDQALLGTRLLQDNHIVEN